MVKNKSRKIIWIALSVFFAVALSVSAFFIFAPAKKTSVVECLVMSTEDGTYANNANGGSVSLNNEEQSATVCNEIQVGKDVTLQANVNDGYSFVGYYTQEGSLLCENSKYNFAVEENQPTVYAKFAKNYVVTLNLTNISTNENFSDSFDLYVGQKVNVYNLLCDKYGEEFASYYEYSISNDSLSLLALDQGYQHTMSTFVVGAADTSFIINPIDPAMLGWTGDGSAVNPYILGSAFDLQVLNDKLKNGQSFQDVYFKLMYDVNLQCSETNQWEPIGGYNTQTNTAYYFNGEFDGDNHEIRGLYINSNNNYQGLFGYCTGTIRNVKLNQSTIIGGSYVGGICGYCTGSIVNCFSSATVSANGSYVGGICGVLNGYNDEGWIYHYGIIDKCYNTGAVSGVNSAFGLSVGGICGINLTAGQIRNVINTGIVTGNTYQWVGGLVGQNHGSVYNSYSTGNVLASYYVGGIAGQNSGLLINCYSSSETIKSHNVYAGGLCGDNSGDIKYCYYLKDSAFDGANFKQNGIGCGESGKSTNDVAGSMTVFDADGCMTKAKISGMYVTSLKKALNVCHEYLIAEYGSHFCVWSGDNIPSICEIDEWNDYSLLTLEGVGSQENPYLLSTSDDFENFTILVNIGKTFSNVYFQLTNNIDLNGNVQNLSSAIGGYWDETSYYFDGIFEGNNYTISGIYIDAEDNYQGLFGYMSGTVKNLNVQGIVKGASYVGGLVGYCTGTLTNCSSSVSVFGSGSYIGGLCGVLGGQDASEWVDAPEIIEGVIDQCYNTGKVTGTNSAFGLAIGGIVGINLSTGIVRNVFNTGEVIGGSSSSNLTYQWVGGLIGQNHGALFNSYSSGNVLSSYYAGGLIGQNSGEVINCYSFGSVKASNVYAGGVIGDNSGDIEYLFYLKNNAKDGSNYVQNGIGAESAGKNTTDPQYVYCFNSDASLNNAVIAGSVFDNLLDALTMGHEYLNGKNGGDYSIWTKEKYPVLYENGVWNAFVGDMKFVGSGTEDDPYLIHNLQELKKLGILVNTGETFSDTYFTLTDNISTNSSKVWNPIGWYDVQNAHAYYFDGIFDGKEYVISGLKTTSTNNYQGLFGYVTGTVKNVTISNSDIVGVSYVGCLAGYATGEIINCVVSGTVTASSSYVGGLVGVSSAKISRSSSSCVVTGSNSAFGLAVGGLIGINLTAGEIINSYAINNVTANTYQWVGGLVGQNHGIIENSYSNCNVSASYYVGGIAGQSSGTITNAYSAGTISSNNVYCGGVVGDNSGTLINNYYMQNKATDGSHYIQNGVGCATAKQVTNDVANSTTAFTSALTIAETTIFNQKTTSLLEALNLSVFENRADESTYLIWVNSTNYPTFGYLVNVWDGHSTETFTGSGTESDPYKISNAKQLNYLAQQVDNGNTYQNAYFVLTTDIYLNKISATKNASCNEWNAIGSAINSFDGNFDGKNYVVSGLYIKNTDSYQGLFSSINGIISNLGIIDGYVEALDYVGGIVGFNGGIITNCYNKIEIVGQGNYVGGIAGRNVNIINNSNNVAEIKSSNSYIGGITGENVGYIVNSFNTGEVSTKIGYNVGGIVGNNDSGIIANCYNVGFVNAVSNVGGIAGLNTGTIQNSYNLGQIVGSLKGVGSVCGINEGDIQYCYYASDSAKCGISNQFGIGSNSKNSVTIDKSNVTTIFIDDYKLSPVHIGSGKASTLLSALNLWVKNNATTGDVNNYSWQNGKNGYPVIRTSNTIANGIASSFGSGIGTVNDPYCISSIQELRYLAQQVNNGNSYKDTYFILTDDIEANIASFEFESDTGLVKVINGVDVVYLGTGIKGDNAGSNTKFDTTASIMGKFYDKDYNALTAYYGTLQEWTPIGGYINGSIRNFEGNFNGCGHIISGIYINSTHNYQGVFGRVNGTIDNVGLINSYICGESYIGGISAYTSGTIKNCYNESVILARTSLVGGICGQQTSSGNMMNCYNAGVIFTSGSQSGGICGSGAGIINNVYNYGYVGGVSNVGSVCGVYSSSLTKSNLYCWTNTISDSNAIIVKEDDIADVTDTLNTFALSNSCLEWLIDENGVPKFASGTLWDGTVATKFEGGNGTEASPYLIANAAQLAYFATIAAGSTAYFALTNDIYLNNETFTYDYDTGLIIVSDGVHIGYLGSGMCGDSSGENTYFDTTPSVRATWYKDMNGTTGEYTGILYEWTSIGGATYDIDRDNKSFNYFYTTGEDLFGGTFDGGGFTIHGLYAIGNDLSYYGYTFHFGGGLFVDIAMATVKNLSFENNCCISKTQINSSYGAICANAYGSIFENCYNNGIVCGSAVAGLIGKTNIGYEYNWSPAYGYHWFTSIYGDSFSMWGEFGTLKNYSEILSSVTNCYNHGCILGSYSACGVIGELYYSSFQNCENYGFVYGGSAYGVAREFRGCCFLSSTIDIKNIINYGSVKGGSAFGVFGDIYGSTSVNYHYDYCVVTVYPEKSPPSSYIKTTSHAYAPKSILVRNCYNCGDIISTGQATGVLRACYIYVSPTFTLTALYNYGTVNGGGNTAGIIASYAGGLIITDCYNYCNIVGGDYVGGICGNMVGSVTDCYNTGSIIGNNYVGGICGNVNSGSYKYYTHSIYRGYEYLGSGSSPSVFHPTCISTSSKTVQYNSITDCYNCGNITANSTVGGVCGGVTNLLITNCINLCDINAVSIVGGVCGYLTSGTISNCSVSGKIVGIDNCGGIVGVAAGGTLTTNYSVATVSGDYYIGGVCGNNDEKKCTISDCYYFFTAVTANSSHDYYQYGIGTEENGMRTLDFPGRTIKFTTDVVLSIFTGNQIQVNDKETFFNAVGIEYGGGIYNFTYNNGSMYYSGLPINTSDYGITFKTNDDYFILACKVGTQVTLYNNNIGVISTEYNWIASDDGKTATKILYADMVVGDLPTPVQTGYTFEGWYTDIECVRERVFAETYYDGSFNKLYAKWSLNHYTLTAVVPDGFEVPETYGWTISEDKTSATKVVWYSHDIGLLPTPYKDGYVFDGWYKDENYTIPLTSSSVYLLLEDSCIYAKFIQNDLHIEIRLDDVLWENSDISIVLYDMNNTLIKQFTNITDSAVVVEKLTVGYYKIFATMKKGSEEIVDSSLGKIYVYGNVLANIYYYSLTLTKSDGIDAVYISAENGQAVDVVDIHNNTQIYLMNQVITINSTLETGLSKVEWYDVSENLIASTGSYKIKINGTYILIAVGS